MTDIGAYVISKSDTDQYTQLWELRATSTGGASLNEVPSNYSNRP